METNPQSFADAVTTLLSSQTQRESVGQQGINIIRTKFDWDVVTQKLENYFTEVQLMSK